MADTEFDRRRRWPAWAAAAVVAVLVLGGAVWWVNRGQGPVAAGPPAVPTATASPSSAARPTEGGLLGNTYADGCRGGPGQDGEMVLAAQAATGTEEDKGAAEFAASYARWTARYPAPPTAEVQRVLAAVAAPGATAAVTELAAFQAEQAQRDVPLTYLTTTTEGAKYYLESATEQEVVVSVVLPVADTDADLGGQGYNLTNTYTMVRSPDGWQVQDVSQDREPSDVMTIGYPFVGGC